ncbi:hypothetical protein BC833DRAFT_610456 [Globomyces pollinis-pini]|nr:hypothetical protein BC833DRAFT_610456 [Globomyces pollinis-pini]
MTVNEPGPWNHLDDATWRLTAIVVFLWLIPLTIETLCRFKVNMMWITVAISIPLLAKAYIVFVHTEYLFKDDIETAFQVLWWYSVINVFVYITEYIALYQRKTFICREKYYLDEIMFLTVCIISTIGNIFCVLDVYGCWSVAGEFILISLIISFLYFDIYYCFKVICLYKGDGKVEVKKQVLVLLPVWWTIALTFAYGYGSVVYGLGIANFYTNALWNIGCMLVPVVSVQSNISTNAGNFMREMLDKGGNPKIFSKG